MGMRDAMKGSHAGEGGGGDAMVHDTQGETKRDKVPRARQFFGPFSRCSRVFFSDYDFSNYNTMVYFTDSFWSSTTPMHPLF